MSQNRSRVGEDAADAGEFAQIALDSIGDAIIGTNLDGHVAYLNPVAERLVGWSQEAALGRPLDEVFRIVDGTQRATALNRAALAIRQNRTVSPIANGVLIRRDGFESAIEDSVAPIHDRAGHVTGAVMVLRDVSQGRATSPEESPCAQRDYLTDWPKRLAHDGDRDRNVRSLERQSLKDALHRALERQEFVLRYQPKINLQTGAITGAEALIRWRHPQRGLVPPAQFIPLAQEYDCIVPIGRWVVHEVCRQIRAWRDVRLIPMPVAINVCAEELRSKDFVEDIRVALKRTALEPCELQLELTEAALLHGSPTTATVLQALAGMGIGLALDDFGTGYSSLNALKRFPIDTLKIDRSFVHGIATDAGDAATVIAVISMGKSLHQRVIAEGVETREQLACLQAQGCTEGQGYYFGRPMVAGELARLFKAA